MSQPRKNWFEWGVFSLASLLVLSVVGFLIYEASTAPVRRPAIEVHLGEAEAVADHFAIPVTVFNGGSQTAEAVNVQVVLTRQDGSEEQADFQIQFVPRRATRRGRVTFETDPNTAKRIAARAVGFQVP